MLIVGIDKAAVEADLIGGRICCPNCEGGLRPWGHGTEREVRLGTGPSGAAPGVRSAGRAPPHTCWSPKTPSCAAVTASRSSAPPWWPSPGTGPSHDRRRPRAGWRRRCGAGCALRRQGEAIREHFTRWAHVLDPGHDRAWRVARRSATPWRPSAWPGRWRSAASGPARCGHWPQCYRRPAAVQHELALPPPA